MTGVDWGQALQVGGFGFLLVVLVQATLAVCMWLIGWIFNRPFNIKNLFKRDKKLSDNPENEPQEEPEYNPQYKIDEIERYE